MTKVLLDFDGVVNAFERALFSPGNPDDFTWIEKNIEVPERSIANRGMPHYMNSVATD